MFLNELYWKRNITDVAVHHRDEASRVNQPALSAMTTQQAWCTVQLYSPSVVKMEGKYRMWYVGNFEATRVDVASLGYAESNDGITWNEHDCNPILTPEHLPFGTSWQTPRVLERARLLGAAGQEEESRVRAAYLFVRDRISQSLDVETDALPCTASQVLKEETGVSFAKSHLLAALLRACPQLLWLSAVFMDATPLGEQAWHAVPASLHALEVDVLRGPPLTAEQLAAIRAAKQRLPSLSWLMVSRDPDGQSKVALAATASAAADVAARLAWANRCGCDPGAVGGNHRCAAWAGRCTPA